MFAWIKENVSVSDYKAYGRLITSPGYTASQTPSWVLQAGAICVHRIRGA